MNSSASTSNKSRQCSNQNIQVFVRVRPLNDREKTIRSSEVVNVVPPKEIVARHALEAKLTKKFTFDRTFAPESTQVEVYNAVVAPLTEEVLAGYNCTVFAYGQTGTGKTHTMVGNELATLSSAWDDNSEIGIIPRSLCHLFDELRMMQMQFTMRVSYLELYNEELCDLLSSDDNTAKIRIYDDSSKKGCVIINGLEEVTVNSKDDVYKLLEKGQERRKTAKTLMNAQSSRSHTVFSIVVHMRETDMVTNEEMVKIGKLNLVDLAGSENVSKAGNEKPIRVRETVNINQSLLTLGRVITALVERTPHVPYRESKLTRLLQESLGGRTKTAIIATISPGHKDIEETLSTLEYAHRAKNIQNKPEVNQKLSQRAMLTQYTEEIERLKRELTAAREKNGIYLTEESYVEMTSKMESQSRELNEKSSLVKSLRDDIATKDRLFSEVSLKLVEESAAHVETKSALKRTQTELEQLKQSFQRTKRRYIEKKMLLYEHMKTEQELTTQATQVLQVADEATEDISKLFETIEERKSVDAKIANASERLVLQVNNNFNEIDQQILTARKQNDKLIKMTIDEIKEATEHQEALHKETGDKLLKIRANFVAKTEEIMHMQRQNYERMLNMHENDNETSREQMKLLLEKTDAFAQEMLNELHTLQHNSEQEKLALQDLLAKSEEQQQRRSASNAAHGMVLQQEISRLKLALSGSLQNLRSVKAQMIEQKQAQSHLERQMSKFFEKSRLGVMETLINGLWNNTKSHEDLLDDCATMAQAYCKEQDETDKYAFNDTVNYIEQRQAIVTQQIGTMCDLGEQTRQHVEQHKEILEHSYKQHEIHNETLANHAASELTSLQDQLKSTAVELEESQDSLQAYVHNQCQFVNERHTLSGSLLCSLQTDVWDKLNDQYAALRNSCVKNVTEIKQTELKTYEPTGQTPSKRDMKYPRVLSRTSPHDTLIKKFRLENNDTDMDLSQTIVEDSDETLEDTQSILPDLEENLLNSTPLQEDNLERTSSDNVLTSSENMDTTELSRKRSSSTVILDVENKKQRK